MIKKFASLAALGTALALGSCTTPDIEARDAGTRPTDKSGDEAGLWYQMDKYEERMKTAGRVNRDPELNAYIRDVTCRITGDYCDDLRIYIVDAPIFNASMAPNGMMTVYSGLLLRAENEAQLACVIGHEFGHFQERHSLELWRSAKASANAALAFAIVTAGAGVGEAGNLGYLLAAGVLADYSRDMERQADVIGQSRTANAGFDGAQCDDVWLNLLDEYDASDWERVRESTRRSSALSTHPLPEERIDNLNALAAAEPGGTETGEASYKAVTGPYLRDWLDAELKAKDFSRNIQLFEALMARGRDAGVLGFYLGEAYRLRRHEGDEDKAIAAWEEAILQPTAPPETWRALGEVYRERGRLGEAKDAYQSYLGRAPEAGDAALIEHYIQEIDEELS